MALEHYQIGDKVRVCLTAEPGHWSYDWQDYGDLWIAGIDYRPETGLEYTISDCWPPRHNGDLTSDFSPNDIELA